MVQAYGGQLLNQKEWENDAPVAAEAEHPLVLATRRLAYTRPSTGETHSIVAVMTPLVRHSQ